MKSDNLTVTHDKQQQMFITKVKGGHARLSYSKPGKNVLDFFETFVPPESRHRGIASSLAEYAFDYAEKHDFKVIPSCPFLRHYLENNTGFKSLVTHRHG